MHLKTAAKRIHILSNNAKIPTEANLALNVTDQEGQTGGRTNENDITRD